MSFILHWPISVHAQTALIWFSMDPGPESRTRRWASVPLKEVTSRTDGGAVACREVCREHGGCNLAPLPGSWRRKKDDWDEKDKFHSETSFARVNRVRGDVLSSVMSPCTIFPFERCCRRFTTWQNSMSASQRRSRPATFYRCISGVSVGKWLLELKQFSPLVALMVLTSRRPMRRRPTLLALSQARVAEGDADQFSGWWQRFGLLMRLGLYYYIKNENQKWNLDAGSSAGCTCKLTQTC